MSEEKKKEIEKEILIEVIDNTLKIGKLNDWIKEQKQGQQLMKADRDLITTHFEKYFDTDLAKKQDKHEWKQIIQGLGKRYSKEEEK